MQYIWVCNVYEDEIDKFRSILGEYNDIVVFGDPYSTNPKLTVENLLERNMKGMYVIKGEAGYTTVLERFGIKPSSKKRKRKKSEVPAIDMPDLDFLDDEIPLVEKKKPVHDDDEVLNLLDFID